MDTRQKIVELSEVTHLLASGNWQAVAGAFDPLTLGQAERLASSAQNGQKLLAVVTNGPETLLPASARAALVAALRCIHAVVIASADEVRGCGLMVAEDAEAEARRTTEFVNFVLQR